MYFAEFLNVSSLERLRILISPTCVGLRYGLLTPNLRDSFLAPGLHPLRFAVAPLAFAAHPQEADLPTPFTGLTT